MHWSEVVQLSLSSQPPPSFLFCMLQLPVAELQVLAEHAVSLVASQTTACPLTHFWLLLQVSIPLQALPSSQAKELFE